uniref:Gamma-glutamylcyclotransferase family protein n=1 Tax=Phlebotomus papatasi TaxID=29031 RepID=A0A1B0DFN3_PHLPP
MVARSALQKLFVYGTLKRGEPNHYWFKKSSNGYAKFVCKAATTKKMPLVIATRYNIPFLLDKPGHGNYVAGEIYEVDDRMMEKIENLEGRDLLT